MTTPEQRPAGNQREQEQVQGKESSGQQQSGRQGARSWMLAGSLLAMSALGLTGLSFLGGPASARANRPVTEVRASAVRSSQTTPVQTSPNITPLHQTPAASLQQGVRSALQAVQRAQQQGLRAQTTTAIDAARRAAGIGDFALGGSYGQVSQHLKSARQAWQDGRSQAEVTSQLSAALNALKSVPVGNAKAPTSLAAYRGATVINPQGTRIGTLDRIDKMTGEALILLDEQLKLGFIPKGGRPTHILARDLIFGQLRLSGETLVMMPISGTAPAQK